MTPDTKRASGDPDGPVPDVGNDVDRPAEGFDIGTNRVHLGDLAVLDLKDPGLGHLHGRGHLRLGQARVLAQLGELIATLLRAQLLPAALTRLDPLGRIPVRPDPPDPALPLLPPDGLHDSSCDRSAYNWPSRVSAPSAGASQRSATTWLYLSKSSVTFCIVAPTNPGENRSWRCRAPTSCRLNSWPSLNASSRVISPARSF